MYLVQVKVLSRRESSERGVLLFGKESPKTVSPLTDVEVVIVKDR